MVVGWSCRMLSNALRTFLTYWQVPECASIPSPFGYVWWRRESVELYREHGNSVLIAA